MNRRNFITGSLAVALASGAARSLPAPSRPTRFSVEVRGTGRDVIMIPGLTAGRSVWNPSLQRLSGYRFHLLQVAGFAGTPVGGNAAGPVLGPLADEIARFIQSAGLARPALVGHSMGGTLAMMIAARQPALAGRIMVVDMLPQPATLFGGTPGGFGSLADSLFSTPSGRRLWGSVFDAFSPPAASGGRSDPDLVGRLARELARLDLTPMLPRIAAPMTVVYAVPDHAQASAIGRSFATAYRSIHPRLVPVEGSGHMVMIDQPARFAAALREFLA